MISSALPSFTASQRKKKKNFFPFLCVSSSSSIHLDAFGRIPASKGAHHHCSWGLPSICWAEGASFLLHTSLVGVGLQCLWKIAAQRDFYHSMLEGKMSCFPCFTKKDEENEDDSDSESPRVAKAPTNSNHNPGSMKKDGANGNIQTQTFTFRELATATKNFRPDCLIGEGGFGRVYKGYFQSTGQVVAVKQLDRNGLQGNKEFTVEVLMLSLLHHPNLVNLIGYCADGEQRLLVYEFMPLGSLEEHLLDVKSDKKPLDWYKRMKIAFGAAQGLEYLHEKANPPVIYRDLKPSNILLDEGYSPKLSDFGLAKLGPGGDKFNVASCVMGTYGYCAPEYARNGELTLRSDVYSFGVVLLELISGRRVIDTTRSTDEQNLVAWAQPMFKDQKRFPELVDPLLKGAYPAKGLNQAVGVAAMCLQEEAMVRPLMADIVMALSFLTEGPPLSQLSTIPSPTANPPIPLEKPQYQPPEPLVAEAMDRSRSNARHCKSSKRFRHGSSRADSSKHFQGLREAASRSSSSLNSKLSSNGNGSNRSSSMHSVDSEESSNGSGHSSPENVTHNSSLNSRQVSVKSTASHKCEVHYFHHSSSGNEASHYDIENYFQRNGNAPSSTSSSTYSHEESEQGFDLL